MYVEPSMLASQAASAEHLAEGAGACLLLLALLGALTRWRRQQCLLGGARKRGDGEEELGPWIRSSTSPLLDPSPKQHVNSLWTFILAAVFVVLAVANCTVGRIMLVPTAHVTLALSQATAVVYVLVYGGVLVLRVSRGLVRSDMLRFPLRRPGLFAGIGLCESCYLALRLSSGSRLPGALVAVLNQVILPGSVCFSLCLLGKRYGPLQMLGILVVIVGVLADTSPSLHGQGLQQLGLDTMTCAFSYTLLAISVVLKELAFRSFLESGVGLDIFVVNTSAAVGQCLGLLCFWPLYMWRGAPPNYLSNASNSLFDMGLTSGLVLLYWLVNISWNVVALELMKNSSAVVMVMTKAIALPASALVFCLRLPLLEPSPFDWRFVCGLLIVFAGNMLYSHEHFGWGTNREALRCA